MIVRDNEGTIRPCLESIRPWVDEMIVVDTGSQDRTPEIARELGARIFHFDWCDHFSAARNESLRHATGEWLFWMDSDDTIDEQNGRKLRALADSAHPPHILGHVMQVHCPGPGAKPDGDSTEELTIVDHVKCFRNHPDLRFEFRIHEQILPSIRGLGGEVGWTDIHVVHSGADHTPEGMQRKYDRDLRILAADLSERPDHPFVLFNLGMTHAHMDHHEQAAGFLRTCLQVSSLDESHLRKAYALLVSCLQRLELATEAMDICQQGRRVFPNDPELLFREGLLLHALGRIEEAVRVYRAVLDTTDARHFSSIDPGILGHKTRNNLAILYSEMGRPDLAEAQWRYIIDEAPGFAPAAAALEQSLLQQGKNHTAAAFREQLSR